MKYEYDLAVIGAGSGGLSLAYSAVNLGLNVVLFEGGKMGGDCLNYGCVPSKAFIKASKLYKSSQLDKEDIMSYVNKVIKKIEPNDSQDRYENMGTTVIRDKAFFIDDHTLGTTKSGNFSAKYIAIATGSSPMTPKIDGLVESGFINNESIFSLEKLPSSVSFIGAGPIGVELSLALARLGVSVNIIEFLDTFLGKIEPEASNILQDKLNELGVKIYLNYQSEKVWIDNNLKYIKIKERTTGETKNISSEEIFISSGRTPNILSLKLENARIEFNNKGIPVDKRLRTNQKHIFAIGDINGLMPFTQGAGYQASVALQNIVFKKPTNANHKNIPYVIYGDPEISSVGFTENSAREHNIDFKSIFLPLEDNDRAVADNSENGFVKLIIDSKEKIIGATIAAPSAGEMINLITYLMVNNKKAIELTKITYPYPTYSEALKRCAGQIYTPKLFNDKVRKILKLLFRYNSK